MVKPLRAGLAALARFQPFAAARTGSPTALFETMADFLQGVDLLDADRTVFTVGSRPHVASVESLTRVPRRYGLLEA